MNHLGQGNGCPERRSYDVLGISPSAAGSPVIDETYAKVGAGSPVPASVANEENPGGPGFRTVVDGISVHYRRDDCATGGPTAVAERLAEVLGWFGLGDAALCNQRTDGNPVPEEREPARFRLASVSPNPYRGGTARVRFEVERATRVKLSVFDVTGRLVTRLFEGRAEEGMHEISWDGTDGAGRRVGSGVYFTRLDAPGRNASLRLVVLRGR